MVLKDVYSNKTIGILVYEHGTFDRGCSLNVGKTVQ